MTCSLRGDRTQHVTSTGQGGAVRDVHTLSLHAAVQMIRRNGRCILRSIGPTVFICVSLFGYEIQTCEWSAPVSKLRAAFRSPIASDRPVYKRARSRGGAA